MTFQLWIDAVLKPRETFASEKNNAGFVKALINLVAAGLIYGVITLILSAALSILVPAYLISGLIGALAYPILLPVVEIFFVGVLFIFAKILGGTGSYTQTLYIVSLYAPVMAVFGAIPIISIFAGLYAFYLLFLAIKESQGLSTGRAALVALILPILAIVVVAAGIAILLVNVSNPALSGQGASTDYGLSTASALCSQKAAISGESCGGTVEVGGRTYSCSGAYPNCMATREPS